MQTPDPIPTDLFLEDLDEYLNSKSDVALGWALMTVLMVCSGFIGYWIGAL